MHVYKHTGYTWIRYPNTQCSVYSKLPTKLGSLGGKHVGKCHTCPIECHIHGKDPPSNRKKIHWESVPQDLLLRFGLRIWFHCHAEIQRGLLRGKLTKTLPKTKKNTGSKALRRLCLRDHGS